MKPICVSLIILFLSTVFANADNGTRKTIELTLWPATAPKPNQKYRLLPKPEEESDSDALPLYNKAIQALPKNFKRDQIIQWLKTPLNQLPSEQVQSTLQQFKSALQLVEQAVKCKQCMWPVEYEIDPETLNEYRTLACVLALQARLKIAQGRLDNAIDTIRTGLAMARHLGKSVSLTYGLAGISTSALMCVQLEQLVQSPDVPNLYWSFKSLPNPFIDLTEQIESEPEQSTREQLRQLMNRLDRNLAVLQFIEALRLYAATHNGQFPGSLAEITQVPLPNDPFTQKPFDYSGNGSEAVIKGPAPKGMETDKAIHYRLILKEQKRQ